MVRLTWYHRGDGGSSGHALRSVDAPPPPPPLPPPPLPRPIVALLAFVGAKDRHLAAYARIFDRLGCDTLAASPPSLALWSPRWAAANARALLRALEAELAANGERPVVFWALSGAAKSLYYQLLLLLAAGGRDALEFARVRRCAAGQALDSPADFTSEAGLALLSPRGPGPLAALARAALAAAAGAADFALLEAFEADRALLWRALRHPPFRGPALLLYSHGDAMCDASRVEALARGLRLSGHRVLEQRFDDSRHAGHAALHPELYASCAAWLLDGAREEWAARAARRRPGGGGGGSGGVSSGSGGGGNNAAVGAPGGGVAAAAAAATMVHGGVPRGAIERQPTVASDGGWWRGGAVAGAAASCSCAAAGAPRACPHASGGGDGCGGGDPCCSARACGAPASLEARARRVLEELGASARTVEAVAAQIAAQGAAGRAGGLGGGGSSGSSGSGRRAHGHAAAHASHRGGGASSGGSTSSGGGGSGGGGAVPAHVLVADYLSDPSRGSGPGLWGRDDAGDGGDGSLMLFGGPGRGFGGGAAAGGPGGGSGGGPALPSWPVPVVVDSVVYAIQPPPAAMMAAAGAPLQLALPAPAAAAAAWLGGEAAAAALRQLRSRL